MKAKAGFQWQNPNVNDLHSNDEALLVAHCIREYFDHYKMDYSKSVYMPEASLDQAKDLAISKTKSDLIKRLGVQEEMESKDQCVLV